MRWFNIFESKIFWSIIVPYCIIIGCSSFDFSNRTKEKFEALEANYREMDNTIQVLTEKIRALQIELENVMAKLRMNTSNLEDLNVDLDISQPHKDVPLPFLREDQEYAAKQGLKMRSSLYRVLNAITRGDFTGAVEQIQKIESENQTMKPETTVLLMFWKFFSTIQIGKYSEALILSSRLIEQFPSYNRMPFILFKQAGVFEVLGDKKARNITLQKLIKDHPNSIEAKEAKKLL